MQLWVHNILSIVTVRANTSLDCDYMCVTNHIFFFQIMIKFYFYLSHVQPKIALARITIIFRDFI